jgi:hypothetical protein
MNHVRRRSCFVDSGRCRLMADGQRLRRRLADGRRWRHAGRIRQRLISRWRWRKRRSMRRQQYFVAGRWWQQCRGARNWQWDFDACRRRERCSRRIRQGLIKEQLVADCRGQRRDKWCQKGQVTGRRWRKYCDRRNRLRDVANCRRRKHRGGWIRQQLVVGCRRRACRRGRSRKRTFIS